MDYNKRKELEWELRNERPNDWVIFIDSKPWKVFYRNGNRKQESYLLNLCQRKTRETGKVWSLSPYAAG